VVALLVLVGPVTFIHAASEASAPTTITPEQKAALDVLDGVIVRFDALLAKDDDSAHHAATKARLDEFKQRRDALRAAYDQTRYDELRVELNLEYQRLASWMAAPKTPPPAKGKVS
jgi:hypothetical protein